MAILAADTGAWKCGTPAEGRVVAAPVHAGSVFHASPCAVADSGGRVRIEPELAFVLARDLPPRDLPYAPADVDAAIGGARLALELIRSRYDDPATVPFPEHLADGLLNQGLFLGPEIDLALARAAAAFPIEVRAEGEETVSMKGRHPDGNPLLPLYWLAEFLRRRGRGLRAGEAVITGSYVPSFEVPAGREITLCFGDLGTLAIRFNAP